MVLRKAVASQGNYLKGKTSGEIIQCGRIFFAQISRKIVKT
jgi:hypothetical protein